MQKLSLLEFVVSKPPERSLLFNTLPIVLEISHSPLVDPLLILSVAFIYRNNSTAAVYVHNASLCNQPLDIRLLIINRVR